MYSPSFTSYYVLQAAITPDQHDNFPPYTFRLTMRHFYLSTSEHAHTCHQHITMCCLPEQHSPTCLNWKNKQNQPGKWITSENRLQLLQFRALSMCSVFEIKHKYMKEKIPTALTPPPPLPSCFSLLVWPNGWNWPEMYKVGGVRIKYQCASPAYMI